MIAVILVMFLRNEVGVCVPIYVKTTDRAERLYIEAASTRVINRGTLRGKAFYHKGRRVHPDDIINELGIQFYDTVRLMPIKEPEDEKGEKVDEAFPLPSGHEGPIE
ncbi:unnamed protein product [Nippostrongylus brasiliensis]|uniref:DNA-binding protein n=1 Tax=Nippostrongylus brasiliensis TaxID=27835 RepID=A0A0N4XUR8_NIPBR|nr:unnamed protein product [Nippostrongylus brasiliensis]